MEEKKCNHPQKITKFINVKEDGEFAAKMLTLCADPQCGKVLHLGPYLGDDVPTAYGNSFSDGR